MTTPPEQAQRGPGDRLAPDTRADACLSHDGRASVEYGHCHDRYRSSGCEYVSTTIGRLTAPVPRRSRHRLSDALAALDLAPNRAS